MTVAVIVALPFLPAFAAFLSAFLAPFGIFSVTAVGTFGRRPASSPRGS